MKKETMFLIGGTVFCLSLFILIWVAANGNPEVIIHPTANWLGVLWCIMFFSGFFTVTASTIIKQNKK
jgi:hypothetical protein